MRMRWLLIGGPVVVGIVVGLVVLVSLFETPCACEEAVPVPLRDRIAFYRRQLTAFDAAHPSLMCPASIDALEHPGTMVRDTRLALECSLSGEPVTRTITIKDAGLDRQWGTADDVVHLLTPAPRGGEVATPPSS
ncbi:MAG TPA: hypothetical protein VM261_13600 [Kofleriaceae bacterium]|nr:hypothetical protein [Kofleriaceae bacterium]